MAVHRDRLGGQIVRNGADRIEQPSIMRAQELQKALIGKVGFSEGISQLSTRCMEAVEHGKRLDDGGPAQFLLVADRPA